MTGNWHWDSIYLTCFGVGLVLSFVAFLNGAMHLRFGHRRSGGHNEGSPMPSRTSSGMSPLNGFSLCAFLCWFGGTGYLLHHAGVMNASVVLLFATLSGLAGAGLIFWFLVRVLLPQEPMLEQPDVDMAGVTGRLSSPVPQGGVGEMLFSQSGARRSVSVRADGDCAIACGAEVIVMRYVRGVAYVRRWEDFAEGLMGDDQRSEGQEVETENRE